MAATDKQAQGTVLEWMRRRSQRPAIGTGVVYADSKLPDAVVAATQAEERRLTEAVASKDPAAVRESARPSRGRMRPDQHALLDDMFGFAGEGVEPQTDMGRALLESVRDAAVVDAAPVGSVQEYIDRQLALRQRRFGGAA
jgi:hypothetical protein